MKMMVEYSSIFALQFAIIAQLLLSAAANVPNKLISPGPNKLISPGPNKLISPGPRKYRDDTQLCSQYNVLPYSESILCNTDSPWYVVASSVAGTMIKWNEDDETICDSTFTVGAQCCGFCSFIQFYPTHDYDGSFSACMAEFAFNECTSQYDTTVSVVTPASDDPQNAVFNVDRSDVYIPSWYNKLYGKKTNLSDRKVKTSQGYKDVFSYSFGVLLNEDNLMVIVLCDSFERILYNDVPNVIVLSKNSMLTKSDRQSVYRCLVNNNLDPQLLCFRNNYQCPARDSFDKYMCPNFLPTRSLPYK